MWTSMQRSQVNLLLAPSHPQQLNIYMNGTAILKKDDQATLKAGPPLRLF